MLGGGIFDWDLELSKCLLSTLEGEAHIEEKLPTRPERPKALNCCKVTFCIAPTSS